MNLFKMINDAFACFENTTSNQKTQKNEQT